MADPDFLKSLASLVGPQQGAPSLLLASNQSMPGTATTAPPASANPAPDNDEAPDDSGDIPAPSSGKMQGPPNGPALAAQTATTPPTTAQGSGNTLQDILKNPDKLGALLDQYQQQKRTAGMIGAVGDMLANRASAGAMYLGRQLPQNDVSGAVQAALPNPYQNTIGLLSAWAQMRKASGIMTPQELMKFNAENYGKNGVGQITPEQANSGQVTFQYDPNSPKGQEIAAQAGKTGAMVTKANVAVDSQAANAAGKIHLDPSMSQYRDQAMNIDRGMQTMGNSPSVTTMNEVAQDFAQALSGKGISSDFRIKEVSTPTIQAEIKKLAGYVSSDPDQAAPPDVVKFWQDMGQRLSGAYDRQMGIQAKTLAVGSNEAYAHNPQALAAQKAAVDLYTSGKWRGMFENNQGGGSGQQYGPDVLSYAKKHNITTAQAQAIKDKRTNVQTAGQ